MTIAKNVFKKRVAKLGRGRPPFKITNTIREKVESLIAVNMTHDGIAQAIGCSTPTLRLYFKDELENGKARVKAWIIESIWASALKGNVRAQILLYNILFGKPLDGRANNRPSNRPLKPLLGKKAQRQSEAEAIEGTYRPPSQPSRPKLVINNPKPKK